MNRKEVAQKGMSFPLEKSAVRIVKEGSSGAVECDAAAEKENPLSSEGGREHPGKKKQLLSSGERHCANPSNVPAKRDTFGPQEGTVQGENFPNLRLQGREGCKRNITPSRGLKAIKRGASAS